MRVRVWWCPGLQVSLTRQISHPPPERYPPHQTQVHNPTQDKPPRLPRLMHSRFRLIQSSDWWDCLCECMAERDRDGGKVGQGGWLPTQLCPPPARSLPSCSASPLSPIFTGNVDGRNALHLISFRPLVFSFFFPFRYSNPRWCSSGTWSKNAQTGRARPKYFQAASNLRPHRPADQQKQKQHHQPRRRNTFSTVLFPHDTCRRERTRPSPRYAKYAQAQKAQQASKCTHRSFHSPPYPSFFPTLQGIRATRHFIKPSSSSVLSSPLSSLPLASPSPDRTPPPPPQREHQHHRATPRRRPRGA